MSVFLLGTFPIALCPRCHQTPKEEVGINVGSDSSKNHTEVPVLLFQNKENSLGWTSVLVSKPDRVKNIPDSDYL